MGKPFGWGLPVERLSWPVVEFVGNSLEVLRRLTREIESFREVLPEQSVGVLVAAALPGRRGLAEVYVDAGGDREGAML